MMADSENDEETELNIARRTRSHLRIDDYVLDDNLNFPDVDMNLYQNPDSEVDTEYKKFLNQCYSQDIGADTNTTDENDPDYCQNDDIFSHGWRFDLNEDSAFQQQNEIEYQQEVECNNENELRGVHQLHELTASTSAVPGYKSPMKHRRKIDMFADDKFAKILNQQLRQHIQLLTQTFLLTKHTTNMGADADKAKEHLCLYLKVFNNKSKPSNLLPALNLVNNLALPKDLRPSVRLSWRPLPIPESVKTIIHENPNVFMYSSLLPQVAFSFLPEKLIPKKPKVNFTINEDNLLAYALSEFKGEAMQYKFIASLLMTAKTKIQISNHIKNIKRPVNENNENNDNRNNNPIKLYLAEGKLPEIDLLTSDADIVKIKDNEDDPELDMDIDHTDDRPEEMLVEVKPFIFMREDVRELSPPLTEEVKEQMPSLAEEVKEQTPSLAEEVKERSPFLTEEVEERSPLLADEIEEHPPLSDKESEEQPTPCGEDSNIELRQSEPDQANMIPDDSDALYPEHDDLMNMDLDDLMAASTTISKSTMLNVNNNSENNKNTKNLKLKKSMLNLMSHNFLISKDMGDLIIYEFLKAAQQKLSERDNLHLLQLLTDLMRREGKTDSDNTVVTIYHELSKFLVKINAPQELHERIVLFLDLDQATKCGCANSYLHWMRFFEFMQHIQLHHDGGVEAFEKKLVRLIDALQKDDPHKIKLAIGNLISKHPFLKREFESLSLEEKPHPSLFICEEDFDDITEPMSMFDVNDDKLSIYGYEHFNSKISKEELSYASQACPCKCHCETTIDGQPNQHCGKCNLKFMKGRMYLVNKIKPILAEWSYTAQRLESPLKVTNGPLEWTFEEDKQILEFCRFKAEQQEDTVSFDATTFEELANKSNADNGYTGINIKRSAQDISDRFNHLMEMYHSKEEISLV